MKVNNVVRFTSGNSGRFVAFGKMPKKDERNDLREINQKALDYLGVQNLSLIMHAPSMPRGKYNQQIGIPYNQQKFIDHAKMFGLDAIQQGPMGKLNRGDDNSPYASSIFAKEPIYIDLSQLTDDEFASILNDDDLEQLKKKSPADSDSTVRANYKKAKEISSKFIEIAYDNFANKVEAGNEAALRLQDEFEEFKEDNSYWLDKYAVVDQIAQRNGTDYYPNWSNSDKTLLARYEAGESAAVSEWAQIEDDYEYEIDKYKFAQFLIDKQGTLDKQVRGDFAFYSDLEVGMSNLDQYIFESQGVFLPGWKMGCEFGGPKNSQQLWGAPVLDPNKLFNKDGSLGPSGEFLKEKLKRAIANSENIRIDHVMGLVNPYVYKEDEVQYAQEKLDNGEMLVYPKRGTFSADYMSKSGLDKSGNFKKILSEIVLPTMDEMNVDYNKVVWEDLGSDPTGEFYKVFDDELGLKGIAGLQWVSPTDMDDEKYAYYSSHDDAPTAVMLQRKPKEDQGLPYFWEAKFLAGELRKDDYKYEERAKLEKWINKSDANRIAAMYALLFKEGKKIQLPFTDFFGIKQSYNTPGTVGDRNWTLGLGSDWEKVYYRNLSGNGKGEALNFPQILRLAIQAKVDEDVKNHKPYEQTVAEAQPIIDKLQYWEEYLQEED